MNKRDEAVGLLQHYIRLCMPLSILTADGRMEVESIVDFIIDAAVEKI